MIILIDAFLQFLERISSRLSVWSWQKRWSNRDQEQDIKQMTIEEKTADIKNRIALFKLKYKWLYDDKRKEDNSLIRNT